ncbi:hypothetical protein PsYK624_158060 [Phanerochaete sordida]|uniref:Uncharacterized protein n=1 Tax=Phanerochaete sordida TaxID=48140 RepID=A0A9P3GSG8_9APHY|nr:hypothetical protein PsYK624_158060 [Phanerochaete sordida]
MLPNSSTLRAINPCSLAARSKLAELALSCPQNPVIGLYLTRHVNRLGSKARAKPREPKSRACMPRSIWKAYGESIY